MKNVLNVGKFTNLVIITEYTKKHRMIRNLIDNLVLNFKETNKNVLANYIYSFTSESFKINQIHLCKNISNYIKDDKHIKVCSQAILKTIVTNGNYNEGSTLGVKATDQEVGANQIWFFIRDTYQNSLV